MNKKHRVDIKITDDMVTIDSTTRVEEKHLDKIRKCPGVYSAMAITGSYSMTILVGEAFDILETAARAIIVLIRRSRLDRLDIRGEHADEIRLLAVNEQLKELDTAIKEALKKSDKCRKKAGRLNKRRIKLYMRRQELRQQEA